MAELTVQFAIISPRQYRDQGAAFESFFDSPPTDDCHQHKKQCTYGESLQAFKFASQLDGRFVAEFTTICIATDAETSEIDQVVGDGDSSRPANLVVFSLNRQLTDQQTGKVAEISADGGCSCFPK